MKRQYCNGNCFKYFFKNDATIDKKNKDEKIIDGEIIYKDKEKDEL